MIAWKHGLLSSLLIVLTFGGLMGQDDGDWINRLKEERDWVPYAKAIRNPDQVKKLYIKNKAPLDLVVLNTFGDLEGLIIADSEIEDLHWLTQFPNLKVFECQGNGLRSLEGIQVLTKAEEISVKSNFISDLSPLKDLSQLKMLNLYENEITTIDSIAHLSQITHLDLAKNKITSIDSIAFWTNLEYLSVYSCFNLKSIDPIANFRKLNSLNLSFLEVPNISMQVLDSIENLEYLCVQGVLESNQDLNPISRHLELKALTMGKNDSITDLSVLSDLSKLEYLDIHSNNVSDIRVVGFMPELVKIVMYRNKVSDITPLKDCLELRSLFMFENPIGSYGPLLHMSQLQHLHLTKDDFNKAKAEALKSRLPQTKIVYM